MKIILALFLLIAVAGAGAYYTGMFSMPDPKDLEKQVKTASESGGSWERVVDIVPPGIYHDRVFASKTGRGAEQKFDRAVFADRVAKKSSPDGYILIYTMSADIFFEVFVDGDGKLAKWHDLPTIKSLTTPGANPLE